MNHKQDQDISDKHVATLLRALRTEREVTQACMSARLTEIDAEIVRLKRAGAAPAKAPVAAVKPAKKAKQTDSKSKGKSKGRIGEAGKERIAAAQRKRWAKARKEKRAAGANATPRRRLKAVAVGQNTVVDDESVD